MKKYIIPIAIVVVVLLVVGLVYGPNMLNQSSGSGTKTYDDSSMGVSFTYPGNWEISNIKKNFADPNEKYVYLGDPKDRTNFTDEQKKDPCFGLYRAGASVTRESVSDWSLEEEMETWAEVTADSTAEGSQVSEKNITVNGGTAREWSSIKNNTVTKMVAFEKNGYLYCISYTGRVNETWESQYNMIISSFKTK